MLRSCILNDVLDCWRLLGFDEDISECSFLEQMSDQ